jgi:hypothetical protein
LAAFGEIFDPLSVALSAFFLEVLVLLGVLSLVVTCFAVFLLEDLLVGLVAFAFLALVLAVLGLITDLRFAVVPGFVLVFFGVIFEPRSKLPPNFELIY